ncbi:cytochrome b561 domain-containing protein At4g18260 [Eutrema salsugineum]|uniref:cytochrome b561 domain-containing protein At4g18260 n=1 Tax=Eutrema salsugineum TaxID=72664 RepID=UPI000CED4327|nr:cytochrome b561 domain-containing protein At4g18260 [Eutrema salsugineum]
MKIFKYIGTVSFSIIFYLLSSAPPFVICSSIEVTIDNHSPSNLKSKGSLVQDKLSHQRINSIKLHGILLWASMGFLMPMGILFIRVANKANENGRKVKVFFYFHVIFQILALVLATTGAIMSLRTLENSFDNNHQRLGLALYAAMWLQFLTGVFKPSRGSKRRLRWFLLHWILGTIVSIVGIINIYTGIRAYHKKTSSSRDSSLWTILFTVQLSCLVFFYLFQDKWEHFQKQRVVLDDLGHHQSNDTNRRSNDQIIQVVTRNDHEQKVMAPQPCRKSNALVNLFKLI